MLVLITRRRRARLTAFLFGILFSGLFSIFSFHTAFASSGRPPVTFIFSGRVLDAQTRQPLANVFLTARVLLDNTTFSASTDSQGRYQLTLKVRRTAPFFFRGGYFYVLINSSKDGYKLKISPFFRIKPNLSPYNLDIQLEPLQPPDTTPPLITINPVATPTNQNITLSYTVTDNITPQSQIIVSGDNSPYTAEGDYNVTLTAKDLAGNTSTTTTNFSIDKTPPRIIITSPQDGSTVDESNLQLIGSIDGIPFSESRALNEGTNTLTKTAVDSAGNSASGSVAIYLDSSGTLIGPEGGEVISGDGKVKLIIPQNALTKPTRIKLFSVSEEELRPIVPQGATLLEAVECRPYGLIFSRPAELIYTLGSAEVPGTPVKLGIYENGKISFTSDPAIVPIDGYTLNFHIQHFSTYAALRNFTSGSMPIGTGVKIPLPDLLTGSFSSSVPITVTPGRKGIQPAVSLNYRSSNPNSWTGVGFSLNCGYIVRSTRLGPPTYNDQKDTFYLITDSGTTELVWLVDNLYQAKVELSFTKFYKETDDSWKAVSKDGSTLYFGENSQAKETTGSVIASQPQAGEAILSSNTFSWFLTKAQDTNSNYISYSYIKDQGKSYLSRIDYTGNEAGISPANSVEFSLEPREDISSSYISTAKIATAKRLKEILVKQNSDLVWRYVLEYSPSPDTNRSLLKSVTQYGSDGKSLPKQKFTYQSAK